jgi:hypothetical protein
MAKLKQRPRVDFEMGRQTSNVIFAEFSFTSQKQ